MNRHEKDSLSLRVLFLIWLLLAANLVVSVRSFPGLRAAGERNGDRGFTPHHFNPADSRPGALLP